MEEFEMTKAEMNEIIAINKEGGDPVMYLSGGASLGRSLQEKVNDYWKKLGEKYKFDSSTVSGPGKTALHFKAKPL